jgi:multidrug efflux pump subunit AcrA (membrane-fusion protein)
MAKQRRKTLARILTLVIVCVIVAGSAYGVFVTLRPSVTTTTLTTGPIIHAVYATGTISPVREYPIRSRRAGTLQAVLVDKGDRVATSQPVAIIADPSLTYAVEKAQAELTEKLARAESATSPVLAEFDAKIRATAEMLEIAQRDETRLRQLFEKQAGSTTDLDRAMDRVQSTTMSLESMKSQRDSMVLELRREVAFAESALRSAQWDLAEQTSTSPIDGVVLDRPISQGTRVAINEVLMRVADVTPDRLVMRAAVDEEDITRVTVGQKVIMTLYAFEGQAFEGKVKTIYAEADPNRRTFEVDVEVLKPNDRFQAGMTGELAFVIEQKAEAKVMPSQAVQKDGSVYVLQDGVIKRVTPEIGVRAVDRAELISGLDDNAHIIISALDPSFIGKHAREIVADPRAATGLETATAMRGANTFRGMK